MKTNKKQQPVARLVTSTRTPRAHARAGEPRQPLSPAPANDNQPRPKAKDRRNNCHGIWTFQYMDLWPSAAVEGLVGHFEGAVYGDDASGPQLLADSALIVHQARRRRNCPEELLMTIAAGIERILEQRSFAECERAHALYVRGLKCSRRRAEVDAVYLTWLHEGTFEQRLSQLIRLGKRAA